ncbi:Copine like protein, partial [Aduncisulcus paluster]
LAAIMARQPAQGYNILMILTDGQANDIRQTVDAIVEASKLPLSIVIIGIGKADFSAMEFLDGDETGGLTSSRMVKAERDNVQFVEFSKYERTPHLLAEEVLREIPQQVLDYSKKTGMVPISRAEILGRLPPGEASSPML